MTVCLKFVFILIIAFSAIFLFLPKTVFAQVVINEFLSNPSSGPDWVEIYNTSDQEVNLHGWILDDEGTTTNMFEINEATISAHGFASFDVGNRLNNGGDTIFLLNVESQKIDSHHYGQLEDDTCEGRAPDGGSWGNCSFCTKGSPNDCSLPTPTPTHTPTPTPTPVSSSDSTPTSTPTPTPKLIPTPTSPPTGEPTLTLTLMGEILGEEATPEAEGTPSEIPPESNSRSINFQDYLPHIFIGLGGIFLAIAGGSALLPKIKKRYNRRQQKLPPLENL